MVLMKSVDKPELGERVKDFLDKEVTVWATQYVARETAGAKVKVKVFIHAPEFGHVEVADTGRVYAELLQNFDLSDVRIGRLSLVKTMNLNFYLSPTGAYEVGFDTEHQAWCIEVDRAFVLDSSFDK